MIPPVGADETGVASHQAGSQQGGPGIAEFLHEEVKADQGKLGDEERERQSSVGRGQQPGQEAPRQ